MNSIDKTKIKKKQVGNCPILKNNDLGLMKSQAVDIAQWARQHFLPPEDSGSYPVTNNFLRNI